MRPFQLIIPILLIGCFGDLSAQIAYTVRPTGFSTRDFDEYAAVYHRDGLVFSSNRKNAVFLDYSDLNDTPLLDMYYAEHKKKNRWGIPELLSRNLTTIYHDGPATFSPDGSQLAFTRNIEIEKSFGNDIDPENRLGLFFADQQAEDWGNVRPFEHNGKAFNTGHASFSPDGNRIYFISDRPGGFGGTDLYYSERNGNGWSTPVNLGERTNSKHNEMFPYMHPNGVLYFSANRPEGFGGLDIYYTQEVNGTWLEPKLLDKPINSEHDDFGFLADEENLSGYFSSHRRGTDDIFRFEAVYPNFTSCDSLETNNYCFTFFEVNSMSLDSMPLEYEWDVGDGNVYRGLEADHCFAGPGHYLIALNIVDTLSGEVYFNEATYDFYIEDAEQPVITAPDSCQPSSSVRFEAVNTNLPGMEVDRFYWDFGDGTKAIGPVVTHTYKKQGTYTVVLGVHSGKDSTGAYQTDCTFRDIVVTKDLSEATTPVAYAAVPPDQVVQPVINVDPRNRLDALFASEDLDPGVPLSPEITSASGLPVIDATSSAVDDEGRVEIANPVTHYLLEYGIQLDVAYSVEVLASDTVIETTDQQFDALQPDYEVTERQMGQDTLYSYTVGEGETPIEVYPVYSDVRERGYDDAVVKMHVLDTAQLSPDEVAEAFQATIAGIAIDNQLFPGVVSKASPDGFRSAGKVFACFFDQGTYNLKAESLSDLTRLAKALQANPGLRVDIRGHTDNTGTAAHNMLLSRNRALTIREYFLQRSIAEDRISYTWFGDTQPLGNNETSLGKELNRRVEVRILTKGE